VDLLADHVGRRPGRERRSGVTALMVETGPSVKDRLISLLNALEYGLYVPDGCRACISAQGPLCGEHAADEANREAAGRAVTAVQDAHGDDAAETAFLAAIASMAQIRLVVASGRVIGMGGGR
jgi:hypothetical protein